MTTAVRLALLGLSGCTGLLCLLRLPACVTISQRLAHLAHAAMAVAMALMVWPSASLAVPAAWAGLLAAATTWSVRLADRAAEAPDDSHPDRGDHLLLRAYPAGTFLAMAWMAISQPGTAMPGMTVPAMAMPAAGGPGAGAPLATSAGRSAVAAVNGAWPSLVTLASAAFFAVLGLWFLARAASSPPTSGAHASRTGQLVDGLMATAMGLALTLMS